MALLRDPKKLSDIELINYTLDVDKEYFNELVDRYFARIFRYANRLLTYSKADAEECLAETFLKAYVNLSTYNNRMSFSAWLYRIAHNQAIDIIRKNVRHAAEEIQDYHAFFNPELNYVDKDALERILGSLSVGDRNILTLFYLEELTLNEISDILKVKPNTVAARVKRARDRARKEHVQ